MEGTELHSKEVTKQGFEINTVQKRNLRIKIIAVSIITIGLTMLGFFIIPRLIKPPEEPEKSIAMLLFGNDSPDQKNAYVIDGVMGEVLNNLMEIKDLRVLLLTSLEQYKGPDRPTIPEIAKKLGVNYIVQGSGQKIGDTLTLRVQLIAANKKEKHMWSEHYDREIKEVKDYIKMQSQIAETIAAKLKAMITPEEKRLIEKIPCISLTAYDFYLEGEAEGSKYNGPDTRIALDRGQELLKKALEHDPEFSWALVGLARIDILKYFFENFSKDYLESSFNLSNKALSIDNQLSDAYRYRGNYYQEKGLTRRAWEEFDKALRYKSYFKAYLWKGITSRHLGNYVQCIKNYREVVRRYHGEDLPAFLRALSSFYEEIGFSEQAKKNYQLALALDGDTSTYLQELGQIELDRENFEEGLNLGKRSKEIDPTLDYIDLEYYYYGPSKYDYEAYLNTKNFAESYEKAGVSMKGYYYRVGYAFWKAGKKEKAKYYFNQEIKTSETGLKNGSETSEYSYYDLAASYAFLGKKELAYAYLEKFDQRNTFYPLRRRVIMKHDPFFDSFRNEERFQKIQKNIENKYQAEHERVRKWLEGQGLL